MKKYKLLKDLPLAKAGTVVQVDLGKSDPKIYENKERNFKIIGVVDRDNMDEWLEEVPEKPKSIWGLKEGDECYSIETENGIIKFIWGLGSITKICRNIGWLFISQEEAEKELKKRKAIQKIKKYCWENDINNNYFGLLGYFFQYNQSHKNIEISSSFHKNGNPLGYFSLENAQKILDNFEKELKIILN